MLVERVLLLDVVPVFPTTVTTKEAPSGGGLGELVTELTFPEFALE